MAGPIYNPRAAVAQSLGKANRERRQHAHDAIRPEHVAGVRHVLRAHGYKVDAHGALTDRLLSAWRNYRRGIKDGFGKGRGTGDNYQPGAKTPHEWNQHNPKNARDLSGERIRTEDSPPAGSAIVRPHENAKAKAKTHDRAAAHAHGLGAKGHKVGGSGIPGVAPAGADVNKLIPGGMAETLAGQQYDPSIREARLQQVRQTRDTNQALTDISSWYGKVGAAQKVAGEQDTAAGSKARGDVASLVSSLQGILGGSRGADAVGAAGVNAQAELAAQGASQQSYNAELAPILQSEGADASSRQKALASQAAAALASQLVDLQGQRGQAKSKAAMDILTANNAARQANFGNRQSLVSQGLAAQSLGLDAAKTAAQIDQYGVENRYRNAQLKAQQQKDRLASGHANWRTLDAPAKENYTSHAVQQAIKDLYGDAPQAIDPQAVANRARERMRGLGFLSARSRGYKGRIPNRQAQSEILSGIKGAILQAQGHYNQ